MKLRAVHCQPTPLTQSTHTSTNCILKIKVLDEKQRGSKALKTSQQQQSPSEPGSPLRFQSVVLFHACLWMKTLEMPLTLQWMLFWCSPVRYTGVSAIILDQRSLGWSGFWGSNGTFPRARGIAPFHEQTFFCTEEVTGARAAGRNATTTWRGHGLFTVRTTNSEETN